jgi:hypothetical protein
MRQQLLRVQNSQQVLMHFSREGKSRREVVDGPLQQRAVPGGFLRK